MTTDLTATIKILESLAGTWTGEGASVYPTISTSHYREELTFTYLPGKPYLHYNQRTWRTDGSGAEVPSHWETGFWRALAEDEIELLCAQSGGRVEAARGRIASTPGGFVLDLRSTLLGADPRVEQTRRKFTLQDGSLSYEVDMQTNLVHALSVHVSAKLRKANG
jgi:hypothetical protein